MNETLSLEAEPFELETIGEFEQEQLGDNFEFSEEFDGEFDQGAGLLQTSAAKSSPRGSYLRQKSFQRRRVAHAKFVKAIGALGKYITKSEGTYRFTLPARSVMEVATKLGIDPQIVATLLRSLQQKNARLRAARVTQAELELEAPSCAGRSAIEKFWWGNKIWLNECQTKALISALATAAAAGGGCAGVAASTIVGAPTVALVCAILGGASGVSSGAIAAIDNVGGNQGVIIYQPFFGPAGIWHQ